MVIHELREGLRELDPDFVFLQEVQGLNQRYAMRFATCPTEPQHEFLADGQWQHVYGCNAVYDHGHHGNAILSRFGFLSFENEDVSDHRYERRGLLHCVVAVPGWRRNLHLVCVHLSLHERGRKRQLEAISGRLEELASRGLPIIIAGDFNDWRHRATAILERRLGMTEVSVAHHRSEEHSSELQSHHDLVCRLLLEKKKKIKLTQRGHITVHEHHSDRLN